MFCYVDGACSKNGKKDAIAGWAFVFINETNDILLSQSGRIEGGTNNIGELTAIIRALEIAKKNQWNNFTIYSDSGYCLQGIQEWSFNWKKFGWYRNEAKTQELKNRELWIQLDSLLKDMTITWEKVKGHSGNKYNTLVDQMAVKETK